MIWVHLAVVLAAIFIGARLGGIAVGYAGGLGVLVLGLLGADVQTFWINNSDPANPAIKLDIPVDVITIIMAVIAAIAAMQVAGGLDYLVHLAGVVLRKHPKGLMLPTAHRALGALPDAPGCWIMATSRPIETAERRTAE